MDFIDQPGASAMIKIYNIIKKKIKDARLVKPPPEYIDGWDIADAIEAGWNAEKIIKFIKDNIISFDSISQKPAANVLLQPFQCLGYNSFNGNMVYYFLPIGSKKVTALTANGLSKMNLLSLAPVTYYEREYPTKTGADYISAANDCIRQCEKIGIYDPLRCRGRGAWYDKGRIVLHLGDKLIVDGVKKNINDIDSYYIYEAEVPFEDSGDFMASPLSQIESAKLIEITNLFSWENNIYSKFFAGWIAISPICGVLDWRPHVWLTGEADTGKTWIQENITTMVLGKAVLNAVSSTTEPGMRNTLRNDARAVRFDEIETNTKEAFFRVQKIIEYARVASSNHSSDIIKGTSGGGSQRYRPRSCFMFSSINVKLTEQADIGRISVLKLVKRADYEEGNKFDILCEIVMSTLTEEYCKRLRARMIKLIPTIRENVKIFSMVISKLLKSKRHGDQIGSLLAGAYALKSDDVISLSAARNWASTIDWALDAEIDNKSDQEKCLETILQQVIKLDSGNRTEAIGSLMRKAGRIVKFSDSVEDSNHIESERGIARDALRKVGITTVRNRETQTYNIAIAENHIILKKLLHDTPWNNGYKLVLMRHEGAALKTAVFADNRRSPAIQIPYDIVFPENIVIDEDLDRF